MRRILFLSVANSTRSPMAEGLARRVLNGIAEVSSAGSRPGRVHPHAIEAMAEVSIDISRHAPRSVAQINATDFDAVITVCADEVDPMLPARVPRLHWPIPNPGRSEPDDSPEKIRQRFRDARDEILWHILGYKEELLVQQQSDAKLSGSSQPVRNR